MFTISIGTSLIFLALGQRRKKKNRHPKTGFNFHSNVIKVFEKFRGQKKQHTSSSTDTEKKGKKSRFPKRIFCLIFFFLFFLFLFFFIFYFFFFSCDLFLVLLLAFPLIFRNVCLRGKAHSLLLNLL